MLGNYLKIFVTSFSEEVTGSNNHVKVEWPNGAETAFVVDCGLFQEREHNYRNAEKLPFNPANISFAIATHVHTDHVGRFPYLVKNGFNGVLYTSHETSVLLPVVLEESYERLEDEYRLEFKRYKKIKLNNKENKSNGKGHGRKDKPRHEKLKKAPGPVMPHMLYERKDVEKVLSRTQEVALYETISPYPGIEITFYPNAHIAGAVLTVCRIFNEDEEIHLLFTGDLGLTNPVTNVVTEIPKEVANKIDYIVCESTYGSSEPHRNDEKQRERHMEIIKEVHRKKGTIMYMSNSLERPQRVGVDLRNMQRESKISNEMKDFSIFLDSTFGIKCLSRYLKLYGDSYLPANFSIVDKTSRGQIFSTRGPRMIICTSPRFYQGSFLNYGAKMLEDPNVTLIFVAYVPEDVQNIIALPCGTEINYMGERIKLRCKRYQFGYYSSHVPTEQMDSFLAQFWNIKALLFNHGTNDSKVNYAKRYNALCKQTHALLYGRTVMITTNGIEKYF